MTLEENLPLHNEQAEWMLIACCIEKPETIRVVTLDHFYLNETRKAFERIQAVSRGGRDVNAITVPMSMDPASNVFYKTVESLNNLPSPAGWSYWFDICDDYRKARALEGMSSKISSAVRTSLRNGESISVSPMAKEMESISKSVIEEETGIASTVDAVLAKMESQFTNPESMFGLKTGFAGFDRITKGIHPCQLIVIAARPGCGKTAFALNVAVNVVKAGHAVAFFSLEMSPSDLINRAIHAEAMVPSEMMVPGKMTSDFFDAVGLAAARIRRLPLRVFNVSQLGQIENTLRSLPATSLIIIDYLQRIQLAGSREGRQFQVATISNVLKDIALSTRIPIIALAQVSRAVEKEDRSPMLSDLRDSGMIENDADIVAFLHSTEAREDCKPQPVNLRIDKHRNGPLGIVPLTFRHDITRFFDREEYTGTGQLNGTNK